MDYQAHLRRGDLIDGLDILLPSVALDKSIVFYFFSGSWGSYSIRLRGISLHSACIWGKERQHDSTRLLHSLKLGFEATDACF